MESPALHFFECYSNEVPGLVHEAAPPKMEPLDHETLVDSDEAAHRLELLDGNVKQYGTVFNTVARVATVGIAGCRVEPGRN
ncbi:hypothetical protein [uncultured Porticoccus sp.]|uniref:hypothetical protein n=1 Tax=uncultured Porticoccus sp. TaxID=1256050 RepID=UPI00261C7511|nr:hypothetical protein [uncultured Porticoccus sp.]